MNKTLTPLRKAKGSVLVLTALSLMVMIGMLGLAIDLSNTYVNKTRLQNALDAMALSAAISLVNNRVANAVTDARNTFDTYGLSSVNAANDIDVCFFDNYSNITASSPCTTSTPTTSSKFVRAAIKPGHLLSVATTFASVIGFTNTNVYASAVSGPIALNNLCTLIPIVTCAEMTPGTPPTVTDSNCTDSSCYGYTKGTIYTLKQTDWTSGGIGPGNFDLLDVGAGANAVSNAMAGSASCQSIGSQVNTEPGSASGATADLNVRFDDYTNGRNAQYPPATYKPDTNIAEYFPPVSNSFATSYKTGSPTAISPPSHAGEIGRRVVHTPIVDCSADHSGGATLPVVGMGCFLLTQKVIEGGPSTDKFKVFAEFIIAEDLDPFTHEVVDPLCEIGSKLVPNAAASPFAPTRVVLFKDPVSPDA